MPPRPIATAAHPGLLRQVWMSHHRTPQGPWRILVCVLRKGSCALTFLREGIPCLECVVRHLALLLLLVTAHPKGNGPPDVGGSMSPTVGGPLRSEQRLQKSFNDCTLASPTAFSCNTKILPWASHLMSHPTFWNGTHPLYPCLDLRGKRVILRSRVLLCPSFQANNIY